LRIVDPINKKTILFNEEGIQEFEKTCYDSWKKNSSCNNCISARAYRENDTFIKFEYNDEDIFLITASPIEIEGKNYIVEMIKRVTKDKSMFKGYGPISYVNQLISEINENVIRDELLGVYNRRYINERLPVDINNSAINKQPLSIVMADIDYFKTVNDTYGHVCGDKVLKDFANLMQKNINSETDWVGRYGGEEFLIVLNNMELGDAYEIAEKIRIELYNTTFHYEDVSIKITSSFGVFALDGLNLSLEEVLLNVDRNLYMAKQSGRNKTCKK
jgi:diguanylate cyclase (GGDEF)-like protein